MEVFYLLNVISLISVFGFAAWLLVLVFKTNNPHPRRNSRSRNRTSVDSTSSDQLYLDTNLEITSSYYYDEEEDDSGEEFQSVAGSRRVSFADKLHELVNSKEQRRVSCIDLKGGGERRQSNSSLYSMQYDGVRKRNKFSRSDSDPSNAGESRVNGKVAEQQGGPPKIELTNCEGDSRRVSSEFELSFNEDASAESEKHTNGTRGEEDDEVSPQIIEEYLSQHSTGMPRRPSDQRRGSFLYRSDAESSSRGLSRASSMSSMNENRNNLDDVIVTPFAQILAKLRDVRHLMHTLTNLPEEEQERRLTGHEQQQMLLDGLYDIDWVLDHLNKIKARNSVGELAQTKFKRMLTRELSQFSETSKSGIQVAEWVSNTYFAKEEDEMDMEKQRSRIPMIYAKRIINQAQQALMGNVPKYGVDIEDTEGMEGLVAQLDVWNFDIFRFNTITKDHPLVSLSYTILQERGLLRIFNIDACTFIKYMFVIEGNYHKSNPYHNAMHGADVMQSAHVLLGCPVIEQVFTDLEVLAALIAAAIHDVDHPGLNNQFLSITGNSLAILYNDYAVLENHHLATAFKYLQEDELNIFEGMQDKQRSLLRKMIIDIVLATDMSRHLGLMADIKTTVESSKVAHNGKLVLESYNERTLVLQGIIHCSDLSSATKSLPLYTSWTERIIEEFYQQGDRERELKIPISPMFDRNNPSIEKSQVGFIDFIVLPLWETLGELMYPYCQDMLNQLNDNRTYYLNKIPESPRSSVSEGLSTEDKSSLQTAVQRGKSRGKGHSEDDKLSDLSSIDEMEENRNNSEDSDSG